MTPPLFLIVWKDGQPIYYAYGKQVTEAEYRYLKMAHDHQVQDIWNALESQGR